MVTPVLAHATAAPAEPVLGSLERPCELHAVCVNPQLNTPVAHQIFFKLNKIIDGVVHRFHITADTNDSSLAWQLKYESLWTQWGFQFVYGTVRCNVIADDAGCF
ncbi:MAG: hypothetical protein AAGD09_03345 [Cyanobacteria bacterium P01_F01_bin.56]